MNRASRCYRKWPVVEQILSRYHSSGLTQREFAKTEGIGCSTLQNYLRRQRKLAMDRPNERQFAEVELDDAIVQSASEAPRSSASSDLRYRVWIRTDIALELPRGFCPKDLEVLMRTTAEVFGR